MKYTNYNSFKEINRIMEAKSKQKYYCNCGHSIFIPKFMPKKMCSWCNKWVYLDKKLEFKEKLIAAMNQQKRIEVDENEK